MEREANRSGGAAVYTGELAARLAARGHRVTLICHAADADLQQVCEVIHVARPAPSRMPLAWRVMRPMQQRFHDRAIEALELASPDVVLGGALPLLRAHARRFADVPLVYVPHALVAPREVASHVWHSRLDRWLTVRMYRRLERWALARARCTVRFSETSCQAMRDEYGAAWPARFQLLPMPVTSPSEPYADFPPAVNPRPTRLLALGRLVETKHLRFLIESLARLTNRAWQLEVVGDGAQRAELESRAAALGLSARIAFRGAQSDVAHWYRQSDLLLFPSRLESLGMVVLEAMSQGLPCLAIRADGVRFHNANQELIQDGVDGFLVDGEESFASRLDELLANPLELPRVGQRARLTIERRHDWETHLDRWQSLLTEVAAQPVSPWKSAWPKVPHSAGSAP